MFNNFHHCRAFNYNQIMQQDPGAVRYGNFPDYYKFNSIYERMKYVEQLQKDQFVELSYHSSIKCIDIGCNTGELTVELFRWITKLLHPVQVEMLGIDLDSALIQCAKNKYQQCSQLRFEQMNVVSDKLPVDGDSFDSTIIFCFSVTLWIHINHGDEALQQFLKTLASSARYLILETQPWKCYRTAARRAKRSHQPPFPFYDKLTIRGNVTEFIDQYLISDCGMCKMVNLGNTGWGRDIILYKKI